MTAEKVLNPVQKKDSLPAAKAQQQASKKKYCGDCPACRVLKTMPASSPKIIADVLKAERSASANKECISGFLQEKYGNSFTQRVFEELNKPVVSEEKRSPKPGEKKISRAHAGEPSRHDLEMPQENISGGRLDHRTRSFMESRMGHDFGDVKVHTGSYAAKTARDLNAHAYTSGRDVFFASGKYKPESAEGRKLLAHELVHAAQNKTSGYDGKQTALSNISSPQDKAEQEADLISSRVSKGEAVSLPTPSRGYPNVTYRKTEAQPSKSDAPGETVSLKGEAFKPSKSVEAYLEQQGDSGGDVKVSFGKLAQGVIKARQKGENYNAAPQVLPLAHPLFKSLQPGLAVSIKNNVINGHVTPSRNTKPAAEAIFSEIQKTPELLGLRGFALPKVPKLDNKLEGGVLKFGGDIDLTIGGAFEGAASIRAEDEKITFQAKAKINVKGLAGGELALDRADNGLVTGAADIGVTLSEKYSGNVHIVWNGESLSGEGQVGYKGDKLQGTVTMKLMDKAEAEALEKTQKAPEEKPAAAEKGKSAGKSDFVVFGEGALTFSFNEWLTGSANVIIDHKGYVTVIGEITPQAEVELFPQKDFIKELPKLEARASYGIPVVGNVFLFVNVGLKLWAKMGPGKLYAIKVAGTYSTDPEKRNNFTIQGSLNVSAGAGLTLRGEGGAGLEILDHDVKAGAGVNGTVGIKGYVDATPIIGYREEGADKKGVFFLRGEMEIAAQPFLGLSGDLFIEVDSPWWSPLPDKKWTWPLGSKEWPLGGSFGLGASVDYVLGSGQVPAVEFHKVDFSAEKFMTDLMNDKTKAKSGGAEDKKGKWGEKNSPSASPPAAAPKAPPGLKEGKPVVEPAKSPVKPGGPKKKKDKKPPAEYAKEGKTPKEQEALEKKKADKKKEVDAKTGKEKAAEKPKETDKEKEQRWSRGANAVKQALKYAEKEGIGLDELNNVLKSIRRHKEYGFNTLEAKDEKEMWGVHGSMSPGKVVTTIKKKKRSPEIKNIGGNWCYPITWPYVFDPGTFETFKTNAQYDPDEVKPTKRTTVQQKTGNKQYEVGVTSIPSSVKSNTVFQRMKTARGGAVGSEWTKFNNFTNKFSGGASGYEMQHAQPLFLKGDDDSKNLWPLIYKDHRSGHAILKDQAANLDNLDMVDKNGQPTGKSIKEQIGAGNIESKKFEGFTFYVKNKK